MEEKASVAHYRHLGEIHLAVLLFGLAGLFGKWMVLPATIIVLGRVCFASLSIGILLRWMGQSLRLQRTGDYFWLALLGFLLAFHWVTFFQAIQLSTVAVGLLTYSTFPVFTAFWEPWFFRERWSAKDTLLALLTFGGVALVVPQFSLDNAVTRGALWGVASGASFALLSILNRQYVRRYSSRVIAFYQDGAAFLFLLPFFWWHTPDLTGRDIGMLVLLGVVFTAVSHTLFINGLKSVNARTASIIATLEPLYGIAAAALLLGEIPGLRVVAGGTVILGVTVYATLGERRRRKQD